MHSVDHLFALLIVLIQPAYEVIATRRYLKQVAAGMVADRRRIYGSVLVTEWLYFFALLAAWIVLERPLSELGFRFSGGGGFWIGLALVIVATLALLYSWHAAASAGPDDKRKFRDSLGPLIHFLPVTDRDYKLLNWVSITAGIVEETVYRGFALWYFFHYMPAWAAVIVTSLVFGLAHSYQGPAGMARVSLVGLALAGLYLLSGSLWLPIVAHAILDLAQCATIRRMLEPAGEADTHPATAHDHS